MIAMLVDHGILIVLIRRLISHRLIIAEGFGATAFGKVGRCVNSVYERERNI